MKLHAVLWDVSRSVYHLLRCVLQRWRDLIVESDPDIIIGYNTSNFDLPYLIDRAAKLKVDEFPYWGRLKRKWVASHAHHALQI